MVEESLQDATLTTWRILKNVVVINMSFMFFFTGYTGATNLQSSINAEAGLGTASLAATYVAVVLSNMFLPAMFIQWLGTKRTMCVAFIFYMPYIAAQSYPTFYTLVPAGILVGLLAGPLWCSKCTYLAMSAEICSTKSNISAGLLLTRLLGFFFTIFQLNQIWGNLISSLVLSSSENTAAVTSINATMIPKLCGSNFLSNSNEDGTVLPTQPPEKIQMITVIYLICMIVSTLNIVFGLDSLQGYESQRQNTITGRSGFELLAVTMEQLRDPNQLLLLILNIFIGQHLAFFGADFTASFVTCAIGTGTVGYVMMTFGLSNAFGCVVTGYLAKSFGRLPLIVCALIVHSGVFITMLSWQPQVGEAYVLFLISMLSGLCDSVWTVQINAYYGVLFRGNEEAAFSNFRLWEATGYIFSYMISSHIRTRYKVYMLLFSLIVGVSGYFTVEYRQHNSKRGKRMKRRVMLPMTILSVNIIGYN